MGNTPPSRQRQAVSPVEKPKEKEYRLKKETDSLKAVVDLFFLENGEEEKNCIIWLTEHAFVRLGSSSASSLPYFRLHSSDERISLRLSRGMSNPNHYLEIHAPTLEEEISCLDLLAGLQDTYFKGMRLSTYVPGEYGLLICPLTGRLLEKIILQNPERHNRFFKMVFTEEQGRVLAVSGTRTDIGLYSCEFEDVKAFVEAFSARLDSGPVKLTISGRLPFQNVEQFVLFLSQQRELEYLSLRFVALTRDVYRAVEAAEIRDLDLIGSNLEGGAALVESVSGVGRGPKGLSISRGTFDSPERAISFLNALRGNAYLERLELDSFNYFRDDTPQALAPALRENKGLTNLTLSHCRLDILSWSELMAAISTHPSLRMLKFQYIYGENLCDEPPSSSLKRDRTIALADMLLVNKGVDEIPFDEYTFDQALWGVLVVPRVECNLYRKWFPALQKIQVPSTRAAIVAMALARVASKPSLLWMVLSQNPDVLCSYLDESLTLDDSLSVLARKRSRSLSRRNLIVAWTIVLGGSLWLLFPRTHLCGCLNFNTSTVKTYVMSRLRPP
jgi:hypothetical protein